MIPPCLTLSNIRYILRVKWSNPGKGVVPSPIPQCSSYWKGRLLIAHNFGRQIYFFFTYLHFLELHGLGLNLFQILSFYISPWTIWSYSFSLPFLPLFQKIFLQSNVFIIFCYISWKSNKFQTLFHVPIIAT